MAQASLSNVMESCLGRNDRRGAASRAAREWTSELEEEQTLSQSDQKRERDHRKTTKY
jgi:hypothetical protein